MCLGSVSLFFFICLSKFLLITNFDYSLHGLDYEVIEWQESTEILDLHRIDIGVYPLIKSHSLRDMHHHLYECT